jgi:hypothetical protein
MLAPDGRCKTLAPDPLRHANCPKLLQIRFSN